MCPCQSVQRHVAHTPPQQQHANTHEDAGKGEAKPQHPVASGASLLEFEVVSLTQA